MSALPAPPRDIEALALELIEWLEGDAQWLFSIGEHWAPYPTEVCLGRIRCAANIVAENLPDVHEECPPVDEEILAEVERILDAREAAKVRWREDFARREAEKQTRAATAAADAVRDKARQERRARQAATMRAILTPSSGATDTERERARASLANWGML